MRSRLGAAVASVAGVLAVAGSLPPSAAAGGSFQRLVAVGADGGWRTIRLARSGPRSDAAFFVGGRRIALPERGYLRLFPTIGGLPGIPGRYYPADCWHAKRAAVRLLTPLRGLRPWSQAPTVLVELRYRGRRVRPGFANLLVGLELAFGAQWGACGRRPRSSTPLQRSLARPRRGRQASPFRARACRCLQRWSALLARPRRLEFGRGKPGRSGEHARTDDAKRDPRGEDRPIFRCDSRGIPQWRGACSRCSLQAPAPWASPLAFRPLPGWQRGASGTVRSLYGATGAGPAPKQSAAWIAKNVRYRDLATADPPNKTLAHLPRDGVIVWAVIFQGAIRGQRPIRLDFGLAKRFPCCEGEYVAGGEYEIAGPDPGRAYEAIVRIYFGSRPTPALRVEAQRGLDQLRLPAPR